MPGVLSKVYTSKERMFCEKGPRLCYIQWLFHRWGPHWVIFIRKQSPYYPFLHSRIDIQEMKLNWPILLLVVHYDSCRLKSKSRLQGENHSENTQMELKQHYWIFYLERASFFLLFFPNESKRITDLFRITQPISGGAGAKPQASSNNLNRPRLMPGGSGEKDNMT